MPVLDLIPSSPVEIESRKIVLSTESDTGLRVALKKSKAFRFFTLTMNIREQEEFDEFSAFWETNYPKEPVLWSNEDCGIEEASFYLDSPLNSQPTGHDIISYAVTLKAKDPHVYTTPSSNILPFDADWGHEVEQDKVILVSDAPSYSRKAAARSAQRRRFKLGFDDRELAEALEMEAFWCHHYPGKKVRLSVNLQEYELHLDGDFWIVTDFKWSVFPTHVDYSFDILEV